MSSWVVPRWILLCRICNKLLDKPTETPCCHLCYCNSCLSDYLRSTPSCPECKKQITLSLCSPNLPIQHITENIVIDCPYASSGCTETFIITYLSEHKEDCEFGPGKCKWNIEEGELKCKGLKKFDLPEHEAICPHRRVDCEKNCGDSVVFDQLQRHYEEECSQSEMLCDKCGFELKRCDLDAHLQKICPERIIDCPFSCFRCSKRVKSSCLDEHLQQSITPHTNLIIEKLKTSQEEQETLVEEIVRLQMTLTSYRSFLMEVKQPLDHSPMNDLPLVLPSKLRTNQLNADIRITNDLVISCRTKVYSNPTLFWGDRPVPKKKSLYFFETRIDKGGSGVFGVGFSKSVSISSVMPGWLPDAYGYHADDGRKFGGPWVAHGIQYGPVCKLGNTMGCGWDQVKKTIFFTLDQTFLGVAFEDVDAKELYPVVGVQDNVTLTVNFGKTPFVFPLESLS